MSIERINIVQPQVTEQANPSKKRSVIETPVDMPNIDNKAASSAITNNARSLIHEFKPAESQEELLEQIKKIEWLPKKEIEINDLSSLEKQDYKTISTFLNKIEGLSPEFKNNIDIQQMLERYNALSDNHDTHLSIKNLNITNLNKLNPELVKQIGTTFPNQFYSLFFSNNQVQEPELFNELYSLIPQDSMFPQYVFQNPDILYKDKETAQKYIERVKMTQNLDKRAVKNMNIDELLVSELPNKKIQKMFEYINNLPEDKKSAFLEWAFIHNLLNFDYSYSVDVDPKAVKLGSSEHVPARTKSQLIKELATFKTPDGFFMFRNKDIDAIVNNENNIAELSEILNRLKKQKIELSNYTLNKLLTKEGLTTKLLEPNFTLVDNIQTNPKYTNLKEILANDSQGFNILFSEDIKPQQIENNLELLDIIKEKYPTLYNPLFNKRGNPSPTNQGYGGSFVSTFRFLNNSNIDKKTLTTLLDSNLLPRIDTNTLNYISSSKNLTEKNIQLVKDLKSHQNMSFIFETYPPERAISEVLKKDIPEGFDISKRQNMIDFLAELHANPKSSEIINPYNQHQYVDILLKNGDENVDAGRKLIDKIIANNLTYKKADKVLSNHSFADSLNILTKLEQNPVLKQQMNNFMFLLSNEKDINFVNQITDIFEYVSKSDNLKDISINPQQFSNLNQTMQENGLGKLNLNLNSIKPKLNELESFKSKFHPELWDNLKTDLLSSIIVGESPLQQFKPENIEYLNKLLDNPEFKKSGLTANSIYANSFLQENHDLKVLTRNQAEALKLIKNDVIVNLDELLTFEGNITELGKALDQIRQAHPNDYITVAINKHTKQVSINLNNRVSNSTQVFDNNMKPLYEAVENFKTDKSGRTITEEIYTDKIHNVKHKISNLEDAVYGENVPQSMTSTYYDKNGKILKTKIYSESAVDGIYNIKELTPDGKIKTISGVTRNSDGIFIRKNLESLDGTKSNIFYYEGTNGNVEYSYQIIDKEGKELLKHHRTTQKVDANHSITRVNGKEYQVKYSDDFIEIFDNTSKTKTKLDLKKLNPENIEVLNDMLHSLPADELINVDKYVNKLILTNRIESSMHEITKDMHIGPHKFIFEHELGHAKDYNLTSIENILISSSKQPESKIAGSKYLQKIFFDELALLKENTSECIQDFVSYFAKGEGEHYAGRLGGLKETIAETNAIQVSEKFHPFTKMRTQILQEYFPKTIAYLIKHKL